MSIPPEIITALIAGVFAFLGAALSQFASRKRTAGEAAKFFAEAEKIRVEAKDQAAAQAEKIRAEGEKMRAEAAKISAEAEALRWQSEKAAADRESDRKALSAALDRLNEIEAARLMAEERTRQEEMRWLEAVYALEDARRKDEELSLDEIFANEAEIAGYEKDA